MRYDTFKQLVHVSKQDICREIFAENRGTIRVKKEETVLRNLAKIFDAAIRISNEKGFQAMSVRDLSSETGLSMGALYAYFSSKEDLLEMLQRQGRTITQRILEERVQGETHPVGRLRAAVRAHLYLSEVMQPWFYFSYMETKNLTGAERDRAVASELHTERILEAILRQGEEEGFFRKVDPQLTASIMKAMLQDWYLKRWKYAKRKVTVDDYAQYVLDVVEAFCLDPAAG